jgi:hypothetical protein
MKIHNALNESFADEEKRAAIELGWTHWSREYSRHRLTAQDRSKDTEVRAQALRYMNKAMQACMLCGGKPMELLSEMERRNRVLQQRLDR